MYFGRKHGGHSVREEMKTCVSLWSLPVPQCTHAGCLGKPHLQMERRRHWRVLSSAHMQSEWLLLLFASLSCSRAICIPLSSRSWRNASEDRSQPHLFCRDGCWTVPGGRRGFGHPAVLLSWTDGDLPLSFPEQNGCCHNQTVTRWSLFDPTTTWKLSRKRAPINAMGWLCVPRKAIIIRDAGIIPPKPRIFLPLAQHV